MGKKQIEVIEEITASGNWTVPRGCFRVDVFLVGGGAGGSYGAGGGGYTRTFYDISVTPGSSIPCVVGSGGTYGGMGRDKGKAGGYSEFMSESYRADGGRENGNINYTPLVATGGDGGSGGAGYIHASGGTDGNDGGRGTGLSEGVSKQWPGGKGQGSSTRCPFTGKLYATGGSTGTGIVSPDGYWGSSRETNYRHGRPNTGDGGSGSGWYGGDGGSGIVILHYYKYA